MPPKKNAKKDTTATKEKKDKKAKNDSDADDKKAASKPVGSYHSTREATFKRGGYVLIQDLVKN